ncbi:MAG: class I SAM-dependent methyltransferase [Actinomycetota bacterium]|nr:class I SAM-dependent methyltransferase [Actinomycetota bacterium]
MADPYEAARPYYQAALGAGVERFLEPRRDSCPWCGSTNLSVRLQTTDLHQRKPGQFILEQCGICWHIFQNPRLSPAGLDFYYRDFYDGLGRQGAERLFKAQASIYRGRAEMLRPFSTPKAWLDVGAGYGHFCQVARKVWPDTIFDGLDQSASVEEAQHRGWVHRGYRAEFVALADELAGRYDVVSMHHYLEHTREPFDELDIAAKILLPSGYLLIEVPDPDYRFSRAFGRMWSQWCQPQHQHMFPLDNLVRALTDRGLSLVAVERGAAHLMCADLFASLGLLLNVCAPDPRLPWLAVEPTTWRRFQRTTAYIVGMPLLAGAFIVDRLLFSAVRRTQNGNVYRVLARKDG